MPDDPRVRLLGAPDPARAAAVLGILDDTAITIAVGTEADPSARVAAAAFVAICTRLFGRVTVAGRTDLPANWWNVPDVAALIDHVTTLRTTAPTPPRRHLRVTVGRADVQAGDLGIGGSDYLVALGPGLQPLGGGTHALGVHAAAALAVGQLLSRVLSPFGYAGVPAVEDYRLDLITHSPTSATHPTSSVDPVQLLDLVIAGAGSVGSSVLALLATACAPTYTGHAGPPMTVTIIDNDRFDPGRNPFRYPALLGGESDLKAPWLAAQLTRAGLSVTSSATTVGAWVTQQPTPGIHGLLVSSVDTLTGRLEVADVLAEQTLSIGVSGLALHAQRERFGGDRACPFCDYVSAAPPLTRAEVHAQATGLDVNRVLVLLQPGAVLTDIDVSHAAAAGKIPADRQAALVGQRLADLVRQAYAEAALPAHSDGTVTVASPHVSSFAGVLGAVEIVKQLQGLPVLNGRMDADLLGLPPGLIRRMPVDATGRCICRSGIRQRWYRSMYGTAQ